MTFITTGMTQLEEFHTINCDPYHFWENVKVAELLKDNKLRSYNQYQISCGLNGILPAKEELFINHAKLKL